MPGSPGRTEELPCLHRRPRLPSGGNLADSSSRGGHEPAGLLPRHPGLSPRNSRPLAASLTSGLWEIETQEKTRRRRRGRPSVHGHIGLQRGPGPEQRAVGPAASFPPLQVGVSGWELAVPHSWDQE